MNAPSRFELHVLGEGEQKLTVIEDTKIPNAATITIHKEDHTLANMLKSQLLQLPYVLFAGAKTPHPLEPNFILKVQTDSDHTPIQAIQTAVTSLIVTLDRMRREMNREFATAKALQGDSTTGGGFGSSYLPGLDGGNDGFDF